MSPDAERPGHIEAASVGARGLLGFYGSTPAYRSVLEIEGRGDLQPELNALSKTGDIMTMIDLVDDDLLRTLAVVGTPRGVRGGDLAPLRRRRGPGVRLLPGHAAPHVHDPRAGRGAEVAMTGRAPGSDR